MSIVMFNCHVLGHLYFYTAHWTSSIELDISAIEQFVNIIKVLLLDLVLYKIIKIEKLIEYDLKIYPLWWLYNSTFINIHWQLLKSDLNCGDLKTINFIFK